MKFPSAGRYNEAVQNPKLYFKDSEIKRRLVQTDELHLPEVLSGGFAYTYRFTGDGPDIAVRCFHREIPELFERYQAISNLLTSLRSRFFVDFTFAERGIHLDGTDLPVVRMRWIAGETLLAYVSRQRSDSDALGRLRDEILAFSDEAEARGYAHGDVQHRNFMVTPHGTLKLVDYDGMYVPALRHLRTADAGHPHFQLPSRTGGDFGPRMDRFPLAVIDLSLEALQRRPALFDQFHRGENLILSRGDFLDPVASPVLNAIGRLPGLAPRVATFAHLCNLSSQSVPSLREFRTRTDPAVLPAPRAGKVKAERQNYMSPFAVVDGMQYVSIRGFVGLPIELVGQVLQVKEFQEHILLRFGKGYSATPVIVVPTAVFSRWTGNASVNDRPWVSATGVLQTHHSGRFSTIQVRVQDTSDLEVLSSKEEADFRLGRVRGHVLPPSSLIQAGPIPASSPKTLRPGPSWTKTPDPGGQVPGWMSDGARLANPSRGQVAGLVSGTPTSPQPALPYSQQPRRMCRRGLWLTFLVAAFLFLLGLFIGNG